MCVCVIERRRERGRGRESERGREGERERAKIVLERESCDKWYSCDSEEFLPLSSRANS